MSSLLSSLIDNLSEGLHSDQCTDCKSCLKYVMSKDNQFLSVKRIIIKTLKKN